MDVWRNESDTKRAGGKGGKMGGWREGRWEGKGGKMGG